MYVLFFLIGSFLLIFLGNRCMDTVRIIYLIPIGLGLILMGSTTSQVHTLLERLVALVLESRREQT
jgi:hypothetical protein